MQAQARSLELQLLEWARDSQPDFTPNKYQTELFSYSGEERCKVEPTPYCFKRANEKFSSFIQIPFREPTPIEESSAASKQFSRGN
jgi:hypothetical protein